MNLQARVPNTFTNYTNVASAASPNELRAKDSSENLHLEYDGIWVVVTKSATTSDVITPTGWKTGA